MHDLRQRLGSGPILGDGAMGTELYAARIPFERCFDELNLSQPTLVQRVHRGYIAAGAEIIETNTFGANRTKLAQHGIEQVAEINRRGVEIAREAIQDMEASSVLLAGAIGPIGQELEPVGGISLAEARAVFAEQITALLEAGPDLLCFETFGELRELSEAIVAARTLTDLPIIAQMTFTSDGLTPAGERPGEVARKLEALSVDVVGMNCGVGPQLALDVAQAMVRATRLPVSVQPNAGFPGRVGGRIFYLASPGYLADYARRFVAAGVKLIGGCCGTTPAHIEAMRSALDRPARSRERLTAVSAGRRPRATAEPTSGSPPRPTRLAQLLGQRTFVVSVELDPPKGPDCRTLLDAARMLKEHGADCINVSDWPTAPVRMSSIATAALIQREVAIETIVHVTTRDRGLMALQADLLGAHSLDVRNVLALTGDPMQAGDYPHAGGVWNIDSIGLIELLGRLNTGVDSAGARIGRPTSFFVGCAVTPSVDDWRREHERLRRKLDAGARYIMTQPLFDMEQLEGLLEKVGVLPVPVVLGVLPLQSSRHAEFLHNEVAGIHVPGWIRERMRQAGDHAQAEGMDIAGEFLELARPFVQGVYIVPSGDRYEVASELAQRVRRPASLTPERSRL